MKSSALVFLYSILLISPSSGQLVLFNSEVNTITTAVPTLAINRNPISGGIGEIGVVSSTRHHEPGLQHNPALLSRNSMNTSIHFSYMPWLRALTPDYNDYNLSGCYSFDSLNTIGVTIDYFDRGRIVTSNSNGVVTGEYNFVDYYVDIRYARTLNRDLSLGIGIKHFTSDLGYVYYTPPTPLFSTVRPIRSYAFDVGIDHHHDFKLGSGRTLRLGSGLSLNNIGPKVSYLPSSYDSYDFIPSSINVGSIITISNNGNEPVKAVEFEFDVAYQASKLLVPSPQLYQFDPVTGAIVLIGGVDSDEFTVWEGILSSFSDAPNGSEEEFQEILHQFGFEIRMISEDLVAALRGGFFLEHDYKGGRKYPTLGAGLQWKEYAFNGSYILPFGNRNYLEHTYKISLGYHF